MTTVLKSLLASAALFTAQTAFAQTTTYNYTGNPFLYFSCGPNSDNTATKDCFNDPAPGNTLTSYTATDHVTATLSFSAPLPPNLNYQDVSSYAGFLLTMNDGHQTLSSATALGQIVKVSTDGVGNLIGPWLLVLNQGNTADSGIASENEPPVNPFIEDSGVLACCDPTRQGNIALNFSSAGTWITGGVSGTPTFGAFLRLTQFDAYDHDDFSTGDVGAGRLISGVGSQLGQNWARASFKPLTLQTPTGPVTVNLGPAAGVWSDSNQGTGSARALGYVTIPPQPNGLDFHVSVVLDGEFEHDWFGLPDGLLVAGAQVLVVDTAAMKAAMASRPQTAVQFFMGGTAATQGIPPQTAFSDLQAALSSALKVAPTVFYPPPTAYDLIQTYPITTGKVHVNPNEEVTIILDVAAYSVVGGFYCCGIGTGVVDFYDTLQPAPNFLVDDNGNPVVVVPPTGATPTPAPTPGNLTLTASQPSVLVGATANLTATLTDTSNSPLSNTLVKFTVTAGPNAGQKGAASTDANGHAVFSYTGVQGAGTDTVQANVGVLTSNLAQQTWTLSPLTSGSACNGTFNGTFTGNLTVAAGQNCVLMGGRVTGHVLVTGGTLSLSHYSIGGNLLGQGGSIVTGPAVTVEGNLQLQNLPASAAPSRICNTVVEGNLQVQYNASTVQIGSGLSCPGNIVTGNLLVQDNTGATQVSGNTVSRNLDCSGNTALTGGGNTATQKLGQCAAF